LLTLPDLPGTVAVFGGGNAVGLLAGAQWMTECEVLYWGDLDEYRSTILARFRAFLPRAQSVLMDLATYEHFAGYQVEYAPPGNAPEPELTEDELVARTATIRSKKRLKRERIDLAYAHSVLLRAVSGAPSRR